MKKHDEGYVLAYVTVVLLIFCLVATTILTGAFQNLQAQQNANQQMKDRYMAQGKIEKVLAQWDDCEFNENAWVKIDTVDTEVFCEAKDSDEVKLWAKSDTVKITCTISADGKKYLKYEVGTAVEEPDVSAPSTTGGAG